MIFQITHQMRYVYSAPVFLEPHTLRLRPRHDASQTIRNFSLTVSPQPAGRCDFLDQEGNHATSLWFTEKTDSLTVATSFEADTSLKNPFNYLVTDNLFLHLPAKYIGNEATALAPAIQIIGSSEELETFVTSLVDKAKGQTLDFLFLLNTAIQAQCTVEIRDHGQPQPAAVTWQTRLGACRDLAVLFITACRSVGLAARFVSGYQEGVQEMDHRHLHAWAEVYIPGGGWRGYDPTLGLTISDRHVVLAASCHPMGAAPITGLFRGTGVTSTLDYVIGVE